MTRKVLIVSNSDDPHVDAVSARMTERDVSWHRINSDNLFTGKHCWHIPSAMDRRSTSSWYYTGITTVWYRKIAFEEGSDPTSSFIAQESEGMLDCILSGYVNSRWINPRESIAAARPKLVQLQQAKMLGFQIPDTLITDDLKELTIFGEHHGGNIVAKPIRAQVIGSGEESLVVGTRALPREQYPAAVSHTACYAQEKLRIISEIRVIVFGSRLYAFRMTPLSAAEDIKQLDLDQIRHDPCTLDEETTSRIHALMSFYKLEFGAIDLVEVEDRVLPVFLELNPNGQWLWLEYVTGVNLTDPFIDLCLS